MTQEKTIYTGYAFKVDTGSVNQAVQATQTLTKTQSLALTTMRKQADANYEAEVDRLKNIQTKTASALGNIRQYYDQAFETKLRQSNAEQDATAKATSALVQQSSAVKTLASTYTVLTQQEKDAADAADSIAKKTISANQIGSRIAGLGSIIGSEGGQGFRDANQLIQLGGTLGAAGIALGTVAIGLRLITDNSEKAAQALQASSNAYYEVAKAAQEQTTQQLKALYVQAGKDLDFAEAFAKTTNENLTKYIRTHPEFTYPVTGIVAEAFAGLGGTLGGLQGSADDANKKLRDAQNTFNALAIELGDPALKVNDFRLQLKDLGTLLGTDLKKAVDQTMESLKKMESDRVTALSSQTSGVFAQLANEGAARDAIRQAQEDTTQYLTEQMTKRENLVEEGAAAISKIEQQQQEATRKFRQNEAQLQAKADLDALLRLQKHNLKLDQLSALRDVEGFINEVDNFNVDKNTQDAKDTLAKQQRQDDFTEQQRGNQQQIDAQRAANDTKLADFDAAQEKEEKKRKEALTQLNANLENALAQEAKIANDAQQRRQVMAFNHENALTDIAYNSGVAIRAIGDNTLAYLQGLAARSASVTGGAHGGGDGSIITNPSGGGGGTHSTYILPPAISTGQDILAVRQAQANQALSDFYAQYQVGKQVGRQFIPAFASGIDRVPRDLIAMLHQGERVVRAVDNHPGGGRPINVYVSAVVGDVAGKSYVDNKVGGLASDIATGIRRAIDNS